MNQEYERKLQDMLRSNDDALIPQAMELAGAIFEEDSKEMKNLLSTLDKVLSDREEMILHKMIRDNASSYVGSLVYRSNDQGKGFVEVGGKEVTIRFPVRLSVELSYREVFFFQVSLDFLESGQFLPTVWAGHVVDWDVSRMPLLHKTLKTATKRLFPIVVKEEMNPQNFLDNALKMKTNILKTIEKPLSAVVSRVYAEYYNDNYSPEPIVILNR